MRNVNILGTEYSVTMCDYDDDERFERESCCAYCDGFTKRIVLCNMRTHRDFENEPADLIEVCHRDNLRHEIVHAFLNESGLKSSAVQYGGAWADNEEMVDWFALQGCKIYKAWGEADCLG